MRKPKKATAAAQRGRRTAARKKASPKLLRRWEASQYLLEVHGLRFAPGTLAKFACLGIGPEVCYVNEIPFYRPIKLDTWAKASISKPTTHARKYAQPRNRGQRPADRRLKPEQGSPSPANTEPPVIAA